MWSDTKSVFSSSQAGYLRKRHCKWRFHSLSNNSWNKHTSEINIVHYFEIFKMIEDFATIEKLWLSSRSPFEVSPEPEWTGMAAILFHVSKPLLQMGIRDLQEDICLQTYKTPSAKEFWSKNVSEKYGNCGRLGKPSLLSSFGHLISDNPLKNILFIDRLIAQYFYFWSHLSLFITVRDPRLLAYQAIRFVGLLVKKIV